MKSLLTLAALLCLSNPIGALPPIKRDVQNNEDIVGPGCTWCSVPLTWTTDQDCNTFEYSAVASSLRNPTIRPANITFNATVFCSEFLKPLLTAVSTFNVTSRITTTTIEVEYLTLFTPTSTATSKAMSMDMPGMGLSTVMSATKTSAAASSITVSPSKSSVTKALGKRDFTIPDYMTPWYYYGRVDPACSCIITSANSPLYFSANETDTIYNTTISVTTTATYTIYP
ncbi:hypothetical protein N431DRAFT_457414 [Stipitochalara longipes BDJ]|nr:hypothetical protein N431DRAFT_457414 [Stipitochalara longipes BDJ]